jgi:hypothetical protein
MAISVQMPEESMWVVPEIMSLDNFISDNGNFFIFLLQLFI